MAAKYLMLKSIINSENMIVNYAVGALKGTVNLPKVANLH